jgi:hypothetical protein
MTFLAALKKHLQRTNQAVITVCDRLINRFLTGTSDQPIAKTTIKGTVYREKVFFTIRWYTGNLNNHILFFFF